MDHADGESFRISVTDNGAGIREDKARYSQAFYQAMDNKPGNRIGLSIVKNVVDLHHGQPGSGIETGWGSTFIVVPSCETGGWR